MKDMHSINATGNLSHFGGVDVGGEITFFTPFNYLFPQLARDPDSLVMDNNKTADLMVELGEAMTEFQLGADAGAFDGTAPAVFTYLGQFIDHDLTARTDRATETSDVEDPSFVKRRHPDCIITELLNGRRPHFDLDSVYGDGPGMVPGKSVSVAEEFGLYDGGKLKVTDIAPNRVDIPRGPDGSSRIADGRNDENLNISQLHAAFHAFHNKVFDALPNAMTDLAKYARARQLTRWAYQYLVIEEYLRVICIDEVVDDTLANGPRHFGHTAGRGDIFMPLEFSVAAFRFGHTMVRPDYQLNANQNRTIGDIFFPGRPGGSGDNPPTAGNADDLLNGGVLNPDFAIDWEHYVPNGTGPVQLARKFDLRLSMGLDRLDFEPMLRVLASRNLLRSFSLSIPTGQAMARAMGLVPVSEADIVTGARPAFEAVLSQNELKTRTPLWYYILREAEIHTNGLTLGELGSRIVCETMVGLMASNPNSYLNNPHADAVRTDGIEVAPGVVVSDIRSFLEFAGVL